MNGGPSALELWREKLEYFLKLEAIASVPDQKFQLMVLIREARRKIDELGRGRERVMRIRLLPMGEKFIGRRQLLKSLREKLTKGKARVVRQPLALQADGGFGKTAVAAELGWRLFEAQQFDFVLFLDASTPEKLQSELASLVAFDELDLPEKNAEEQEARRNAVLRWLGSPQNAKETLLILDNADSAEARQAVRRLLPKVAACSVFITTRYSGDIGGVHTQELTLFTKEEAREYLRRHLSPELLAKSTDEAELDAVAQELDHLPLALEVAVSYVNKYRLSINKCLEEWRNKEDLTSAPPDPDKMNYPVALDRVWEKSTAYLSENARKLLRFLVWMEPRPSGIPIAPFEEADRKAFVELSELSMIKWKVATDEVSIHRILQRVIRHSMSDEDSFLSLKEAVKRVTSPAWFNARRAVTEGSFLYAADVRRMAEHLTERSKNEGDRSIGLRLRCAVVAATLRTMWKSSPAALESEEPAPPETIILRYKELPTIERIAGLIKALEQEWNREERALLFEEALKTASEGQEIKGFRMLFEMANPGERKQLRASLRDTAIKIATPKERYLACVGAIDLLPKVDEDLLIRTALEAAASSRWPPLHGYEELGQILELDRFMDIAESIPSFPAGYRGDAIKLAQETVTKLTDKEFEILLGRPWLENTSPQLFDDVFRELSRRNLKRPDLDCLLSGVSADLIPEALQLIEQNVQEFYDSEWPGIFEALTPRLSNELWPEFLKIVAKIPNQLRELYGLNSFVPKEFANEFLGLVVAMMDGMGSGFGPSESRQNFKAKWLLALELPDAERDKAFQELRDEFRNKW